MLYNVVLTFESVDEILRYYGVTIQMKATEQCLAVMLFIMQHKVVPGFETVGQIEKCGHSNQSY